MNSLSSKLATYYAKELSKRMDSDYFKLLTAKPRKPLTRKQKFKLFMTRERNPGEWVTRKLMSHYNIHDCDY